MSTPVPPGYPPRPGDPPPQPQQPCAEVPAPIGDDGFAPDAEEDATA